MKARLFILAISLVYVFSLCIMGISNFCYNYAQGAGGEGAFYKTVKYLEASGLLNPLNSDISYAKFNVYNEKFNKAKGLVAPEKIELLNDALRALKRSIDLRPTEASYHMFYGITLLKRYPLKSGVIYKEAKRELLKASELKPVSKRYETIANRF